MSHTSKFQPGKFTCTIDDKPRLIEGMQAPVGGLLSKIELQNVHRGGLTPVISPGEDGRNLVAYLYMLKEHKLKRFDRITTTLQKTFPSYERMTFPPSSGYGNMTFHWKWVGQDPIPAYELPEELVQFVWLIAMCTAACDLRLNGFIATNIESTYSEEEQRTLMRHLIELCNSGVHVTISTQSTVILDELSRAVESSTSWPRCREERRPRTQTLLSGQLDLWAGDVKVKVDTQGRFSALGQEFPEE